MEKIDAYQTSDGKKFFDVIKGILTMNGHGNKIVKMKGFAYVQTRICAKADQNRTGQNNSFDSQQRRCSHRTSCSDDSVVLSGQENRRDCRNVGRNRSNSFAYDPKFQEWSGRCFLWVEDYNTYITASWTLSEESGDIAIRGHFREGEYHIPSP